MPNRPATLLLAQLIKAGKIPGLTTCDLLAAALTQEITGRPARIRMPALYCDGRDDLNHCGTQLVDRAYALTPVTDLRLLCYICAYGLDWDSDLHLLWGSR